MTILAICVLFLMAGIIKEKDPPAKRIDKSLLGSGNIFIVSSSRLLQPATVIDSSVNGYTLWTQMQECIGYNPIVDAIQIVNRGFTYNLNVHQTSGSLSFWVHDSLLFSGGYPNSIASDNGTGNGPHLSFSYLFPGPSWGGMAAVYETGGWFSQNWGQPVDVGPGNLHVCTNIGKQLTNGDILFIGVTVDNQIRFSTWDYTLTFMRVNGIVAPAVSYYWGYDINGEIAYVFYYDDNLNVYYKTTTDGINWSAQQSYNLVWPNPYPQNLIFWTQMAVTDAGNPILVFDNLDYNDYITGSYPYYGKVYVSYQSGQPCVEVSSTFGAPDTECFYPTIAAGGNKVAVLYCMSRNNEPDSLNWWDFFVNWSTDNGRTWQTPINYTQSLTDRPGLPQLAKRIDTLRNRVYFIYAVDMVENHDPLWHVLYDPQGLDPMYICFDYASYVEIEEGERSKVEGERLELVISPNVLRDNARIQYTISEKQYIRLNLYDILGRRVVKIANGITESGSFIYNLKVSGLGQGTYLLILEGKKDIRREKLLIMR